jgi:hypothetical protein
VRVVGGVLAAEEEDLAGELLADLAGEVGAAEAAVEAGDVGIGLLEAGVLALARVRSARRAGCARRRPPSPAPRR